MTPRGTVAKREDIPGTKKKFAYLFYLKNFWSHLIEEEKNIL